MGVDQPRQDEAVAQIDHVAGAHETVVDLDDAAVLDHQGLVGLDLAGPGIGQQPPDLDVGHVRRPALRHRVRGGHSQGQNGRSGGHQGRFHAHFPPLRRLEAGRLPGVQHKDASRFAKGVS